MVDIEIIQNFKILHKVNSVEIVYIDEYTIFLAKQKDAAKISSALQ